MGRRDKPRDVATNSIDDGAGKAVLCGSPAAWHEGGNAVKAPDQFIPRPLRIGGIDGRRGALRRGLRRLTHDDGAGSASGSAQVLHFLERRNLRIQGVNPVLRTGNQFNLSLSEVAFVI